MPSLTVTNARILTLAGDPLPRRGPALHRPSIIEQGYVGLEDDRIVAVDEGAPGGKPDGEVIDAEGRVLMPAFVDCHTHACWVGDRFDEFEMKLGGASYLSILRAGGGIMSTVRAVRAATEEELTEALLRRLARMAALGTATVEVKSGYGLEPRTEIRMLRAICAARARTSMTIVPTFLGAHALDPDNPHYIDETIQETLPAVATEFPGIPCDAYCEEGAWSLRDTRRLFEGASEMGCPLRVHSDQFHSLGMTRLAVEMGARSVDHLEAVSAVDLEHLVHSDTIAVVLPCSGFHLDDRYAPAREIVDAGGVLAIATNYNPGSAPCPSLPFAIALSSRKLRLTPVEAITCCTYNAACVLGLQDEVGSIEVGKRADLQLWDCTDERELAYEFAGAGPQLVVVGGEIVKRGLGLET